jgi:hypothetical protein
MTSQWDTEQVNDSHEELPELQGQTAGNGQRCAVRGPVVAAVTPRAVDKRAWPGNKGSPAHVGQPADLAAVRGLEDPVSTDSAADSSETEHPPSAELEKP